MSCASASRSRSASGSAGLRPADRRRAAMSAGARRGCVRRKPQPGAEQREGGDWMYVGHASARAHRRLSNRMNSSSRLSRSGGPQGSDRRADRANAAFGWSDRSVAAGPARSARQLREASISRRQRSASPCSRPSLTNSTVVRLSANATRPAPRSNCSRSRTRAPLDESSTARTTCATDVGVAALPAIGRVRVSRAPTKLSTRASAWP